MIILLIIVLLIIDIASKLIIDKYLIINESIVIIKNFLSITYVKNTGCAWSIMNNNTLFVSIISGIIIIFLCYYLYKLRSKSWGEKIALSLVLAGAIGNFFNRIIYGAVIDFIDITIFGYDYPIFNVADIFIVVGVLLMIIITWRGEDHANRSK